MTYRQKNTQRVHHTSMDVNNRRQNNCPTIIRRISGAAYCFFWLFSIISGFFLLIFPAIPLAFLAPKVYRRWSDIVFGMWEPYPVAMMEILFNVRVTMSGDNIDPSEGAIFIMNHRTRLDWNFLWAAMYHSGHPHCHSLKFILKAPLMHIPGPGWVMQACSFLFIHRNWEKDQQLLSNSLDYLKSTARHCQILIFPEGTDLTARSLERSHQFADKNNLPRYCRVLHPKTTGFIYLINKMRKNNQLCAVYDLTIGYPKTLPETEMDMARGKFPEELHFNVRRYHEEELPNTENELKNWLTTVWKEKEQKLSRFYSNSSFTNHDFTPDCLEQNNTNEIIKKRAMVQNLCNDEPVCHCNRYFNKIIPNDSNNSISNRVVNNDRKVLEKYEPGNILYLTLIFWTYLVFLHFQLLLQNSLYGIYVFVVSILFLTLSFCSGGFHQIIANYHKDRGQGNILKKYE